jgi:hypothetical protein
MGVGGEGGVMEENGNLYLVSLIAIQFMVNARNSGTLVLPFEFSITDGDERIWVDTVWDGNPILKDVFGTMYSAPTIAQLEEFQFPITLAVTDANGRTGHAEITQKVIDDCRAEIRKLQPN